MKTKSVINVLDPQFIKFLFPNCKGFEGLRTLVIRWEKSHPGTIARIYSGTFDHLKVQTEHHTRSVCLASWACVSVLFIGCFEPSWALLVFVLLTLILSGINYRNYVRVSSGFINAQSDKLALLQDLIDELEEHAVVSAKLTWWEGLTFGSLADKLRGMLFARAQRIIIEESDNDGSDDSITLLTELRLEFNRLHRLGVSAGVANPDAGFIFAQAKSSMSQ